MFNLMVRAEKLYICCVVHAVHMWVCGEYSEYDEPRS